VELAADSATPVARTDAEALEVRDPLARALSSVRKLLEGQLVSRSEVTQGNECCDREASEGSVGLGDMDEAVLALEETEELGSVVGIGPEHLPLDDREKVEIRLRCEANVDPCFMCSLDSRPSERQHPRISRAGHSSFRERPRRESLLVEDRLEFGTRPDEVPGRLQDGAFELLDQAERRPLVLDASFEPRPDSARD
jgi:hypothetical protein